MTLQPKVVSTVDPVSGNPMRRDAGRNSSRAHVIISAPAFKNDAHWWPKYSPVSIT